MQQIQTRDNRMIPTLRQAWTDYQMTRKLKPTTLKNYRLRIERNLHEWLDLPMNEITKTMALIRFRELSLNHEATANSTFRTLKALYNFAMAMYEDDNEDPLIRSNPVEKIARVRAWNKDRVRRRSFALSLPQWYRAVLSLNSALWRDYWLLLLFTGMRKSEALKLEWRQVNLATGVIQLENTKNGDDRLIPLSEFTWRLLLHRFHCKKTGTKYVFPNARGGHLQEVQSSVDEIIRRSGIVFACHDTRRTFATIADEFDIRTEVTKALLGHRGDVTEDYTCRSVERLRRATQKITDGILKTAGVAQ
ncbi:MAG: tyrosine-type recombinase/integrase [Candidatus Obscuribacterales bacterium]|nr:tyrosine-type recombinase/integrase [Candidatus Obscuribacterales bacterium]